jgi:hypothetical protein
MPETKLIPVKELNLDLLNFRTVKQIDEVHAIKAMISISPERFWALMESLISDGYLPTENIIVLKSGSDLVVKEGNRRVASLKLIFGYVSQNEIELPESIKASIANIAKEWKDLNLQVPCTIYDQRDAASVDKIVTLAHGKGEKASRDQWNAVARARHNRDVSKMAESALDLLEKYLKSGNNITPNQAARWAGDYPLSVLDEAVKKISPRFDVSNSIELSSKYPTVKYRDALESILRDIGLQTVRFETIRNKSKDFAESYGIPAFVQPNPKSTSTQQIVRNPNTGSAVQSSGSTQTVIESPLSGVKPSVAPSASASSGPKKSPAPATNDPQSVMNALKIFVPLGPNRQKVTTLLNEAKKLKLSENPIAFCFILRSMFEISAKAYCEDHKVSSSLKYKKANGDDKNLADVLGDITKHLTNNQTNKDAVKMLHGAMVELGKKDGFLSVTSMNQLVHNPTFSVTASDVSSLFNNVFPLLHAMNQ